MFGLKLFPFFLITVANATFTLNLCDPPSTNLTSYLYKTQETQNCNCTTHRTICVRKCCAVGFHASRRVCLRNANSSYNFRIPVYNDRNFVRFANGGENVLVGTMRCDFFPLVPARAPEKDAFAVQENGQLWTYTYGLLDNDRYCVDDLDDYGLSAFVCHNDDIADVWLKNINVTGMIISMPFLLATFIAYALLPDRNLHMKALMSYVINLMFGYLLLVIIQLSRSSFSPGSCTALGYFCIFFFLVSFFWMNVICIDIWFAFSRFRGLSGSKSAERKRFLLYCAYAWGMSILHVVVILIIDKVSGRMAWYAPGIGDGQCFIKSGVAELLYFYGPMGLLITINVVLFAATAIKIRNVKKDTAMLKKDDSKRHSYENDKQKFNLYLKLLFAMGVNWSLEIVSWAVNLNLGQVPAYIWYLTDFCNAIYGVFIFFMFVFKKSIWKLLKKRYYSFIGKPHLAHSMTQNPTRTTSYSTAHTSINDRGTTETSTLSTEA